MAEQIIFTGRKVSPLTGQYTNVTYNANVQTDGYAYFNDDFQYRCLPDGSNLQLFYYNKEIWINTNNIEELTPFGFDPLQFIQNLLSGGTNANATGIAGSSAVEASVQWLINKATSNYVTYSQSNRNLNQDGYSYDCSSFVITGFNLGGNFNVNATYTGNMKNAFIDKGFVWIAGSRFESYQLLRGDILLNETLHTQVYIGNNQDVNCGSTPAGIEPHSPDNYGRGWDGILRYGSLNNF